MSLLSVLVASSISTTPVMIPDTISFGPAPTVNLSAIRLIWCESPKGPTFGTGWMVNQNILVTAKHVVNEKECKDIKTGNSLTKVREDSEHDLVLMTGEFPTLTNYIRYSCDGYKKDEEYSAYGYSDVGEDRGIIFRMDNLIATDELTGDNFIVEGTKMPGMRLLRGYTVPGMSGGPYMKDGVTYGITNVVEVGYSILGIVYKNYAYSYELKDTILCKPNHN